MRPDGWEKLHIDPMDTQDSPEIMAERMEELYEAGADAMLEAIRARGFISGASLCNVKDAIGWAGISPDSKWYPIPEEK